MPPKESTARRRAPANETSGAKFKRLAELRMTKALSAIKSVARLADKGTYSYTDKHVAQISEELTNAVKGVQSAFANPTQRPKEEGFQLSG